MLGLYDIVQDFEHFCHFIPNSRLRDRWGNRVRLLCDVKHLYDNDTRTLYYYYYGYSVHTYVSYIRTSIRNLLIYPLALENGTS